MRSDIIYNNVKKERKERNMSEWNIGIDIGGTFTDLVGVDVGTGRIMQAKLPSTPIEPSQALVNCLREFLTRAEESSDNISNVIHGTTVATNALIQFKGVRTGLLITRGTRAVYVARRSGGTTAMDNINLKYQKPRLLVPQRLTEEIEERVSFTGEILTPLNEEAAREAVRRLRAKGVESIAVCLLFSFMNPTHERRLAEIIREEIPECRVSISSEVHPVIREYQRLSTTTIDAYVGPIMEAYLTRLEEQVANMGIKTRGLFVMQSSGGVMHVNVGGKYPVQTLLSGPVGGAAAGSYLDKKCELGGDIVTYDMGGTSTDICVIREGAVPLTTEGRMGGQDAGVPMRDIISIGAGGGTIAWIDSAGILRTGPHSAGANPGPACYGLGGEEPTVTDADLLLGYLNPDNFLGGRMKLNPSLAEKAVMQRIGKPLGMDLTTACHSVVRIVDSVMATEIRLAMMEKGYDHRRFSLIAFGGAGPVHASLMLKDLEMKAIVAPRYPGLTSAMGLLTVDLEHYYMQSLLRRLDTLPVADVNRIFVELKRRATEDVEKEGFNAKEVEFIGQADLRYVGQGYELTIPTRGLVLGEEDKLLLKQAFDAEHLRKFVHNAPDLHVELVNVRLTARKAMPSFSMAEQPAGGKSPKAALVSHRRCFFNETGWVEEVPIFNRDLIKCGNQIVGPAIVEQEDSTVVICPGQVAEADKFGNLILRIAEAPKVKSTRQSSRSRRTS